jgi:hypothetical protein
MSSQYQHTQSRSLAFRTLQGQYRLNICSPTIPANGDISSHNLEGKKISMSLREKKRNSPVHPQSAHCLTYSQSNLPRHINRKPEHRLLIPREDMKRPTRPFHILYAKHIHADTIRNSGRRLGIVQPEVDDCLERAETNIAVDEGKSNTYTQ